MLAGDSFFSPDFKKSIKKRDIHPAVLFCCFLTKYPVHNFAILIRIWLVLNKTNDELMSPKHI